MLLYSPGRYSYFTSGTLNGASWNPALAFRQKKWRGHAFRTGTL